MRDGTAFRLVLVTAPEEAAALIAERLVAECLAACVNALPGLRSTYRWQGEVQQDQETLLLIKTSAHLLPRLEERIGDLHPYDVPEIIALALSEGSAPYLDWIAESTTAAGDER